MKNKQRKIEKLKAKARKHYLAYQDMFAAGAGHALSSHIMPEKARHAREFNAAMTELQELCEDCPKNWKKLV